MLEIVPGGRLTAYVKNLRNHTRAPGKVKVSFGPPVFAPKRRVGGRAVGKICGAA